MQAEIVKVVASVRKQVVSICEEAAQSTVLVLLIKTLNEVTVGWVTKETEESEKFNKYVQVSPVIAGSAEFIAILKVLSPFFVRTANPSGGTGAPVDVNVAVVVFAQIYGATMHAGIVKVVVSVMK